jgi:hypothetical protein
MPAPIRDQSVDGALVQDLKTRLLLCMIEHDLDRDVAYFTFGSYALPIGP